MSKFHYSKRTRHHFKIIENTTLFLDIVGFTKLGDNEQMRRAVQELHSSISEVLEPYKWDEPKNNDVILIPSGDGYGIAFSDDITDEIILDLVVKLYKKITERLKLRIGISRGPNIVYMDLNDKLNIIGWGINRAQRVMTVAEANQILCDSSFAEHLLKIKQIKELHKLGETKVKHGEKVIIYNYFGEGDFGNKTAPELFSKDI